MAKIILGDDDVAVAGTLAAAISEGDCHVVTVASTAPDVLAAVGRDQPALCVLERWFDHGDALDLLAGLREHAPSTKVVVLTADPNRDGARQALDRGAEGFVHKTRGVSALLSAIERVLAGATVVELPPRWKVSRSVEADDRPASGRRSRRGDASSKPIAVPVLQGQAPLLPPGHPRPSVG